VAADGGSFRGGLARKRWWRGIGGGGGGERRPMPPALSAPPCAHHITPHRYYITTHSSQPSRDDSLTHPVFIERPRARPKKHRESRLRLALARPRCWSPRPATSPSCGWRPFTRAAPPRASRATATASCARARTRSRRVPVLWMMEAARLRPPVSLSRPALTSLSNPTRTHTSTPTDRRPRVRHGRAHARGGE